MRTCGKGLRFGDGRDCYLVKQNCLYNEILQLIDAAHYLSSIDLLFLQQSDSSRDGGRHV